VFGAGIDVSRLQKENDDGEKWVCKLEVSHSETFAKLFGFMKYGLKQLSQKSLK
jgi:hypothetical protein